MDDLVGRYSLVRLIREQADTIVYEGRREAPEFRRRVAIKIVHPDADEDFSRAYADEARLLGYLEHRNIVRLLDAGRHEHRPFLVFDYVDGVTVGELLRVERGGISAVIALFIAVELAHALAYAHELTDDTGAPLRIVHRDVTPANVILSWAGDVILTDFGIAKARERSTQTAVGVTKGTPSFMAPEQLRADHVDLRSDIFGLGCLLHFMLVGRSAVDARRSVSLDRSLPPEILALLDRCTREDRAERFADMRALAAAAWNLVAPRATKDPRTRLIEVLDRVRAKPQVPPARQLVAELFSAAMLPELPLEPSSGDGEPSTDASLSPHDQTLDPSEFYDDKTMDWTPDPKGDYPTRPGK